MVDRAAGGGAGEDGVGGAVRVSAQEKGTTMTKINAGTPKITQWVADHKWTAYGDQYMAGMERGDSYAALGQKLFDSGASKMVLRERQIHDMARKIASAGRGSPAFLAWMESREVINNEHTYVVPIRAEADSVQELKRQVESLQGKVASQKVEAEAKLRGLVASERQLLDENASLLAQMNKAKTEAISARDALASVVEQRGAREAEGPGLRRQIEELRKRAEEAEALNKMVEVADSRATRAEADRASARSALVRSQAEVANLRREVKALEEQLAALRRKPVPVPEPAAPRASKPKPATASMTNVRDEVHRMMEAGLINASQALKLLEEER